MTRYLAIVGDTVVGRGNSATEALLDAYTAVLDTGVDLDPDGEMRVEQVDDGGRV